MAETKDLIANAKYKTRQDEQEVDTRLVTYIFRNTSELEIA